MLQHPAWYTRNQLTQLMLHNAFDTRPAQLAQDMAHHIYNTCATAHVAQHALKLNCNTADATAHATLHDTLAIN